MEGIAMQRRLYDTAELALEQYGVLGTDEVAMTSPIFELLQANQDLLYSRLFQT